MIALFLISLLLGGPLAYAQKVSPSLVRKLLKTPVNQPIAPDVRQSLAQLSPQQLNQLVAQLERANIRLARKNEQTRLFQKNLFESTRPAIFRALPPAKGPRNSYTGTLFEVERNGLKEIFGVVPMHALRNEYASAGFLSYKFTALVEQNGAFRSIPAWVVQLSSSKMGDVALVKFRVEDEIFLSALPLAKEEISLSQPLYAQGFACNLLSHTVARPFSSTSIGLLSTRLPAANVGDRAGFCGSALVNEKNELAGIHVGSRYAGTSVPQDIPVSQEPLQGDTGYVAPSSFLQGLVDAYYHPGKAVIPVNLLAKEVTRLRINEYISRIEILDEKQQILWNKNTEQKSSLHPAETALSLFPQARWIRLHISQTHWQKNTNGWFVLDDGKTSRVVLVPLPEHN